MEVGHRLTQVSPSHKVSGRHSNLPVRELIEQHDLPNEESVAKLNPSVSSKKCAREEEDKSNPQNVLSQRAGFGALNLHRMPEVGSQTNEPCRVGSREKTRRTTKTSPEGPSEHPAQENKSIKLKFFENPLIKNYYTPTEDSSSGATGPHKQCPPEGPQR